MEAHVSLLGKLSLVVREERWRGREIHAFDTNED